MALTEDLTWQLDAGFVLNTSSLGLPFVDIIRATGFDSAPIRETERDHEGVDGGFMDAEFEKGRPVLLEGTAYADINSVETFMDTLKGQWAPGSTIHALHYKAAGVTERIIYVKARGIRYDWQQMLRTGCMPIQFVAYAEDPRIYDALVQTIVIAYGGAGGNGFQFNMGFNLDFGGGALPSGSSVLNSGNRPTPAVFTIAGPISNPLIANDTTGNVLNFIIDLAAGDTLAVDLANHTVTLNGVTNRRSALIAPNWFLLQPGANQIRFGGTNGTGSTLTIVFQSAWR